VADDGLLSDFSYPASPGDYFPPILGDPGEEEAPDQAGLLVPHVIHAFNDNDSLLFTTGSINEVTILETEIPAGQMQEGDVYSLRMTGESFNDTGAPRTLRLRFYFNGGVELDTGARSIDASAELRKWWIQIDMAHVIASPSSGSATAVKIGGLALCTATGASESWGAFGASESSVGKALAQAPNSSIPLAFSAQLGHVDAHFDISPGWHLLRFPHKH
jgi:hypothetical protein